MCKHTHIYKDIYIQIQIHVYIYIEIDIYIYIHIYLVGLAQSTGSLGKNDGSGWATVCAQILSSHLKGRSGQHKGWQFCRRVRILVLVRSRCFQGMSLRHPKNISMVQTTSTKNTSKFKNPTQYMAIYGDYKSIYIHLVGAHLVVIATPHLFLCKESDRCPSD